jgi:adenylylsulfate kinase
MDQDRNRNVVPQLAKVAPPERARLLGQQPVTLWLTGLSGAGKTTLAIELDKALVHAGRPCFILDGDNVRTGLCRDLGFGPEDRHENIRRVAEVARLMNDAGLIVLSAFISPYRSDREMARSAIGAERFMEVYVEAPLEVCEKRDPKGLYRTGENCRSSPGCLRRTSRRSRLRRSCTPPSEASSSACRSYSTCSSPRQGRGLMRVPYDAAIGRSRHAHSKWPARGPGCRLEPEAWPVLAPRFRFSVGDKIFTIGSCFARNIEALLKTLGFRVPTADYRVPLQECPDRWANGILNHHPACIRSSIGPQKSSATARPRSGCGNRFFPRTMASASILVSPVCWKPRSRARWSGGAKSRGFTSMPFPPTWWSLPWG